MRSQFWRFGFPLALFAFVVAAALFSIGWRHGDERLVKAEQHYYAGESASTIIDRQKQFNEALKMYAELEKEYQPEYGTGKLYYNIGNTYFQLNEFPLSILYYKRATSLMPRNSSPLSNLKVAESKLGLQTVSAASPFSKVFFFHTYLSVPERLQLVFVLLLLVFIFASVYMWKPSSFVRWGILVPLILAAPLLLSLGYSRYISPLEAVAVKSVNLRLDAGPHYAEVGNGPLAAGSTVEVLDISPDKKWLKVITKNGTLGYVPSDDVWIVNP